MWRNDVHWTDPASTAGVLRLLLTQFTDFVRFPHPTNTREVCCEPECNYRRFTERVSRSRPGTEIFGRHRTTANLLLKDSENEDVLELLGLTQFMSKDSQVPGKHTKRSPASILATSRPGSIKGRSAESHGRVQEGSGSSPPPNSAERPKVCRGVLQHGNRPEGDESQHHGNFCLQGSN